MESNSPTTVDLPRHRPARFTDLQPGEHQVQALGTLMGQVVAWSNALAPLREVRQAA
jgi:hypothetical protein